MDWEDFEKHKAFAALSASAATVCVRLNLMATSLATGWTPDSKIHLPEATTSEP